LPKLFQFVITLHNQPKAKFCATFWATATKMFSL